MARMDRDYSLFFQLYVLRSQKKDPKPFPFDRISESISLYIFF